MLKFIYMRIKIIIFNLKIKLEKLIYFYECIGYDYIVIHCFSIIWFLENILKIIISFKLIFLYIIYVLINIIFIFLLKYWIQKNKNIKNKIKTIFNIENSIIQDFIIYILFLIIFNFFLFNLFYYYLF